MTGSAGLSVILIAGSSHVGKTTLATRLSEALGWRMISTDGLARHPGRPWPVVRPQVAEFYERLTPETIYWFLRVHHENMWPGIRRLIDEEIEAGKPFVLEGSALRPELIAPLLSDSVAGICLYTETDFLHSRMRAEARYDQADEAVRVVMDKFIARSLRDNSEIFAAAKEHGLRLVDTADSAAVKSIYKELVGAAP
ncbi:AAA family ATPase [Rhizobium sp. XQZ8]|uniref:AAA family ATPase n=1 Tax=Rhizobium populisoli TaxID=2859785 RepID=UPI001CA53929|nr:AAA family ATPase [Rhizobium populisoli]